MKEPDTRTSLFFSLPYRIKVIDNVHGTKPAHAQSATIVRFFAGVKRSYSASCTCVSATLWWRRGVSSDTVVGFGAFFVVIRVVKSEILKSRNYRARTERVTTTPRWWSEVKARRPMKLAETKDSPPSHNIQIVFVKKKKRSDTTSIVRRP
jgi:hypothetical protein